MGSPPPARRLSAPAAPTRCAWAVGELERRYHDEEWGVPLRDDRGLFELLVLEGAQAGLSWSTILKKREAYRRAFAGFDVATVAEYSARDVHRLLGDGGIVRNRLKIESTIANARAVLALRREQRSFTDYVWQFVNGHSRQNSWRAPAEVPAETEASRLLSRDLRRRGFRFVGPTICYAFMQAAGLVNDHTTACFRWAELGGTGRRGPRVRRDGRR